MSMDQSACQQLAVETMNVSAASFLALSASRQRPPLPARSPHQALQTSWTIASTSERRYNELGEHMVYTAEPRARDMIISAEAHAWRQVTFIHKRILIGGHSNNNNSQIVPLSQFQQSCAAAASVVDNSCSNNMCVDHSNCLPLYCALPVALSKAPISAGSSFGRPISAADSRRSRAIERFNKRATLEGGDVIPQLSFASPDELASVAAARTRDAQFQHGKKDQPSLHHSSSFVQSRTSRPSTAGGLSSFGASLVESSVCPSWNVSRPATATGQGVRIMRIVSSRPQSAATSAICDEWAPPRAAVERPPNPLRIVRRADGPTSQSGEGEPDAVGMEHCPEISGVCELSPRLHDARLRRSRHEEAVMAAYRLTEERGLVRSFENLWRAGLSSHQELLFGASLLEVACDSGNTTATMVLRLRTQSSVSGVGHLTVADAMFARQIVEHSVICIRSQELKVMHRKGIAASSHAITSGALGGTQTSVVNISSLLTLPVHNRCRRFGTDDAKRLRATLCASTQCTHHVGGTSLELPSISLSQLAALERFCFLIRRVQSRWRAMRASRLYASVRKGVVLIQRVGAGYLERRLHLGNLMTISARLAEEAKLSAWGEIL